MNNKSQKQWSWLIGHTLVKAGIRSDISIPSKAFTLEIYQSHDLKINQVLPHLNRIIWVEIEIKVHHKRFPSFLSVPYVSFFYWKQSIVFENYMSPLGLQNVKQNTSLYTCKCYHTKEQEYDIIVITISTGRDVW